MSHIIGICNRRDNVVSFLIDLILAPIAVVRIQSAIPRSREFMADRIGAEITGTPSGLAGVLAKKENIQSNSPINARIKQLIACPS